MERGPHELGSSLVREAVEAAVKEAIITLSPETIRQKEKYQVPRLDLSRGDELR